MYPEKSLINSRTFYFFLSKTYIHLSLLILSIMVPIVLCMRCHTGKNRSFQIYRLLPIRRSFLHICRSLLANIYGYFLQISMTTVLPNIYGYCAHKYTLGGQKYYNTSEANRWWAIPMNFILI